LKRLVGARAVDLPGVPVASVRDVEAQRQSVLAEHETAVVVARSAFSEAAPSGSRATISSSRRR